MNDKLKKENNELEAEKCKEAYNNNWEVYEPLRNKDSLLKIDINEPNDCS